MNKSFQFSFREIKDTDRNLVHNWLTKAYVAKWFYGEGLANTLRGIDDFIKGMTDTKYWLACDRDKPFAFLITSLVKKPEDELSKWSVAEGTTITLDMLIGEEEYLGKKLSDNLIKEFLSSQFPEVEEVLIDPEASNSRAVHVYEKVGFQILGEFIPSHSPHPHYMMRLNMNRLENTLGLPLEYSSLSRYYDLLSQGNDESTHLSLEKILRENKARKVLDLTCGTGAQILWLASKGFQMVGSDQSHELLKIGRVKAKDAGLTIPFHYGDMREVRLGKFDAVITIFNSIGHLTKKDFETALKNIRENLNPGGVYIFDIFNLEALSDQVVKSFAMDNKKSVDKTTIRHIQKSTLDRTSGRLTSFDEFTIQEGTKEPVTINESFSLQLYTAYELEEMLIRNGFEIEGQYDLDRSPFSNLESERILTVGKRVDE
ncbi:MAG: bifunctional GNAT family N-acetyltransferase/class I SAM-dependent methyltransferase [Chlamydiota bacterium]